MKKIYTLFLLATLVIGSSFATEPTVGYADQQVKIVHFYPNPATTVINFEFQKPLDKSYTLQVYSFMGKKVNEVPVSGGRITLSLDGYFRGLYTFQLRDKSGRIIESGKFQVIK